MCVKQALQRFVHLLRGSLVKWYTDNQGVAAIVKSGRTKVHLHKLAMEIFLLSKEHDVSIEIEWIPRSENEGAHYLSKIVDFDDWCVRNSYFRAVDSIWGPFTVDCFANSVNAKVSRFYSLSFQPGSLGVDSLAFDWGQESCWLVPPVCLIPHALMRFLNCRSRCTLVVPFWPSSLFWPYISYLRKRCVSRFCCGFFCSFKTVLKFLFKEQTKKLVLVHLHFTLQCCF